MNYFDHYDPDPCNERDDNQDELNDLYDQSCEFNDDDAERTFGHREASE